LTVLYKGHFDRRHATKCQLIIRKSAAYQIRVTINITDRLTLAVMLIIHTQPLALVQWLAWLEYCYGFLGRSVLFWLQHLDMMLL
jgi:hypothetical protein